MGAPALRPGLGRNHRRHGDFDQIIEFQRLHPRGIEYPAFIPDLGVSGALRHFQDFIYSLLEQIRKTEYTAMRLHGFAQRVPYLRYVLAILLGVQPRQPRERFIRCISGQMFMMWVPFSNLR